MSRETGPSPGDLGPDQLPRWLWSIRYDAALVPSTGALCPGDTANCQRFAYRVLAFSRRVVPPHRSSELWEDPSLVHPDVAQVERWDLVLFNGSDAAYGAHVAVVIEADRLLHLCKEVGGPTFWTWADFAARDRYRTIVGAVRVPVASTASASLEER